MHDYALTLTQNGAVTIMWARKCTNTSQIAVLT